MEMAAEAGVPAPAIGRTGGSRIRMAVAGQSSAIDVPSRKPSIAVVDRDRAQLRRRAA